MKRTVTLLALLAALCCLLTVSAAAAAADAPTSGTCGANLTWTLDPAGTLTIAGKGEMEDFVYYDVRWNGSYSSIKAVVIESGVTTIGNCAFMHFASLTSVTIPESVTSIGGSVFYDCPSLTSITIPESVTSIGTNAFDSCKSLTSITIPRSVKVIGEGAFRSCLGLTDVNITDMDAWCRIDFGGSTATPMYCANNIWLNGQKIVSATVPEGFTEVKAYTFYGFKDLISATIPESVTSIGEDAFYECSSLTRVTFAENSKLTTIGEYAFNCCYSLTSITIPESVTNINKGAFYCCKGLADVYITDLAAWCQIDFTDSQATPMFYAKNIYLNGEKIVSVTVPGGITEVKAYTFFGFKDLIQVTIPEGVTTIGDGAFYSCTSLISINIPEGVTAIGEYAFYGCRSLPDIIIPTSVTTIGSSAFSRCDSLISVTFAENSQLTAIGSSVFSNCSSLTDVNIPAGVTDIGEHAFWLCSSLTGIEIPEGVTVIQPQTFIGASSIQRVALPKGLKGVLGNAFDGCTNIKEVFYAGSETEWKALPIAAGNDPLKNAQVYFNSTLDDYYCRISVQVSSGGRVTVDHTTAKVGETVTVTAAPYQGYGLTAVCVDGVEIEGNTFAVTGNHTVSAVFTRVPVVGGTEDFRLEGLSVRTAGEELQELPQGSILVTVAVRHLNESGSGTILLAQYDSQGRYRGLMWLTLDEMPQGMTLRVTLPVDNSSGEIANLKVFVVEDLTSPLPLGTPVSFGQV